MTSNGRVSRLTFYLLPAGSAVGPLAGLFFLLVNVLLDIMCAAGVGGQLSLAKKGQAR